jgi:hypothetical protein
MSQSNGQVDVTTEVVSNGHMDLTGVRIDPDKLKIRELVEIEKLLGRKVAGDMMTGEVGADLMQALLWVALRRKHPQTTFEQAGEFDFNQITGLLATDDDDEVDAVDPQRLPSGNESSAGSPAPAGSKPAPSSATSTG